MIKVAILTVSDSCAKGQRQDISGQTIKEILPADTFDVCECKIVSDDVQNIRNELVFFSDARQVDIVLTTGGTGLGPRDNTPEATLAICQKMVPGLTEAMRAGGVKKTKTAILSRAVAGIRGRTLIINLPGSPKSVKESLEAILDVLPHAKQMLAGHGHDETKITR